MSVTMSQNDRNIPKAIAGVLLIVGLVFLYRQFNVNELFTSLLGFIEQSGSVGVLIFISAYIAATVLFLPGSILTLGAGLVFGLVWGTIYVSIASTTGAFLACYLGRYFLRDKIEEKLESRPKFKAIDAAVAKEGWKIVFLTRLSPVFPFNLLNYAYGLTKVKISHYVLASWVGMIPGTILYVYLGSLAGSLATLGANTESSGSLVFKVVGLLATLVVTIYVTKVAKKALDERI